MSDERSRPPSLWVIGVLAVLLGMLGACGGTFNLGSVFLQDTLMQAQEDLIAQGGGSTEQQRQQIEMQRRTVEVAQEWRIPTVAAQIFNILGSLGLLIGAVLLFRWSPATFLVFLGACLVSALGDVMVGVFGVLVQQETMAVMTEGMANTGDAQADRMAQGIFRASGTFGMCFAIGWGLAKLAFYAGAILQLRRPEVRRLFEE